MFDVNTIITSGGIALVSLIVYAEVGLFLGFFLPGDTLLIAAGILAAAGKLNLIWLIVAIIVSAIAGDNTGYWIGRHLGPRLFRKPDGLIFQKDHIEKSHRFFDKHGSKTLLISHFLPFLRSFVPLLAGAGSMPYRKFVIFNAIGDVAWGVSITLVGYFFGSRIPNIDHYIMYVLAGVILFSVIPTTYRVVQRKREQSKN